MHQSKVSLGKYSVSFIEPLVYAQIGHVLNDLKSKKKYWCVPLQKFWKTGPAVTMETKQSQYSATINN